MKDHLTILFLTALIISGTFLTLHSGVFWFFALSLPGVVGYGWLATERRVDA